MTRQEQLACLTGRPCDVCKFHDEKGCHKWSCVFEETPDEDVEVTEAYRKGYADGCEDTLKHRERGEQR